jgi:D-alanyl-D-alanine carboxypeptidase
VGYNTVAVLFNDHMHRIQDDPDFGRHVAQAVRAWTWPDRARSATHFGSGQVISQAHADYSQVVVVGRNAGKPIVECEDLDHYALGQIADALRRHGWSVKPPRKSKATQQDKEACRG